MSCRFVAWASLLVAITAGCESEIIDASGGGDEGGAGAGGVGGGGDGGSGACAAFADAPEGSPVTIRFRNETGLTVFLPSTCSHIDLEFDTTSPGSVAYWSPEACFQSCEDLQHEEQIACGPCAPESYELLPGATLELPWDGRGITRVEMPEGCYQNSPGQASCGQVVAAPAATFRIAATGYSACGEGDCMCDPATHACFGSPTGLIATANPATFDYPADGEVEVLFDICAFGCAGGG
ncbi:MAG: hypothetical protein HOW73_06265 [Polyangiaceae bacterium]|nr:hypothetical protein [Polyangiaceae bacterium]